MSKTKTNTKLKPVTKAKPCPVCDGRDKCSVGEDGLILCGRRDSEVAGFAHLGAAKDPTWHLYRVPDDNWVPVRGRTVPSKPVEDLAALARQYAAELTTPRRLELAARLGLPVRATEFVADLGFNPGLGCWTVPERDARGEVIGITTRFADGTKRAVPGSRRGLTIPGNYAHASGPVLVVEGMSDACALAYCGLKVVGRPSARGGAELLATLLGDLEPGRDILVVCENDKKPDGSWPGREGAFAVAGELTKLLKRRVMTCAVPEQYKDAREWVMDRLGSLPEGGEGVNDEGAPGLGRDIAASLSRVAQACKRQPVLPRADRFPMPIPISLVRGNSEAGTVAWVWDGFLVRGGVTLLSALPKAGKTTLLSHLFKSLEAGGPFCGRALSPGRVLIVSEESPETWANRRELLHLSDCIQIVTRPFFRKVSPEEWQAFLASLANHLNQNPADLVVFDTLADLWPVRDENSATEVQTALKPTRHLADGRAVLLVHHLRKGDGAEGTGSRGSGALAGFVDVIAELRRAPSSSDPSGSKRVLKAVGRPAGVPKEWAIELTDEGYVGGEVETVPGASKPDNKADRKAKRAAKVAEDNAKLREAIRRVLAKVGEKGMTYGEVRDGLPAESRCGENQLRHALLLGSKAAIWFTEQRGSRMGGPLYRLAVGEEPANGELFPGGYGLPD